jgi:beta-N-acetylhexosaminidase
VRRLLPVALFVGLAIPHASAPARVAAPTLQQLIGQKLFVRMDGKTTSASLLARARRGEIGGVIIHTFNFDSAAGLRSITSDLQEAAAAGGQPPLLIAVDQEGGPVKVVPWTPPTLSPREIGTLGSGTTAHTQGRSTGAALRRLGVNTDFAPVADVPGSTRSFLYQQGRTWSFEVHATARLGGWFALGLGEGGALATAKHFPGLGLAERNTDQSFVRITATKAALAPGLQPFKTAIADRVPLIMLSNVVYTAYDGANAAAWSHAIGTTLLRGELGFRGATITDSLDGAAHARHVSAASLALRAARAGTDLLLLTGSEEGTRGAHRVLLEAAAADRISHDGLLASYRRILALKAGLRSG